MKWLELMAKPGIGDERYCYLKVRPNKYQDGFKVEKRRRRDRGMA
jgi:hypothetical protein